MTNSIKPCVGCDETVDSLYCSFSCMREDDARIFESPITGTLYYVTEYTEKGDEKFVAQEKQEIVWPDDEETD